MSFIWPTLLYAFLAIPVLIGAYLLLSWRSRRYRARFGSLGPGPSDKGAQAGLRGHVPPILFLAGVLDPPAGPGQAADRCKPATG